MQAASPADTLVVVLPLDGFSLPADPALDVVSAAIRRLDPDGSRWAAVIRHTYDMIYNGQETGRYRWDQLMKTEKTGHCVRVCCRR